MRSSLRQTVGTWCTSVTTISCVIELYWIPHPIAHGSSIDPPSIAMLRELRASSVGAVYLRRSRVERRARVKGISSVDYYRARCKATHMRSKSFSNVVKRRQEEDDERGDQRKTTTKRERGQRESPGKPATALDGRRAYTLTSTTFQEPPPGTY